MVEVQPPRPAWGPGHKFGRPCECNAKGDKKLKYIQPERPAPFSPVKVFHPPESRMPDGTTYKLSYEAFDPKIVRTCRGIPTITRENLISAGEFSGSTTHKMSYGPWPGRERDPVYYPKDHKLIGEGPMQLLTTHRHDYTPKCKDTNERVTHSANLGFANAPMENNSVMTMSYRCPDYKTFKPATSYKPHSRYAPPDSPLEGKSVQKLSYLPWQQPPKDEITWGRQGRYDPPKVPLDTCTIYSGSYIPPGKLVEDDGGHVKGCYCLFPAECASSANIPPKKLNTCPHTYDPDNDPPRINEPQEVNIKQE